jgi:hypothetical protein
MTMDLRMRRLQWLAEEPRRLTRLVLVALVAVYAGWIGYQFVRNKLIDFNVYYISAAGFRQGVDIYALAREHGTTNLPQWARLAAEHGIDFYTHPYLYPPLTAQIVLPLTLLPPRLAGMIWLVLTAATFVLSAWLLGKSSALHNGVPLAYFLLLLFVPPLTTMHAGQVNGFLLLSLSLAVYGLGRRDWVRAGIGVALGTLFKLIPVALLLYLAWRRQWKATGMAVTLIAVLLLTAPLTLEPGALRSYARHFLILGRLGTVFRTPPNQSLNGFFGRLLADLLHDQMIYRIYLISAGIVVLGTVACCWPFGPRRYAWRLEFSLIVCALLLITPYTWYHQLVLLLIPFFMVAMAVIRGCAPRWWLALLALGFLVTDLHGLLWHQLSGRMLLSMPFYTTVMLWGMLAWLIIQRKRSGAAQGSAA